MCLANPSAGIGLPDSHMLTAGIAKWLPTFADIIITQLGHA